MLHVLLDGIVVGLVTGLVGAGGGFLVVPALALLGGLPMTVAVGTSLLVISMKSFAGLAGYLASVHINWGFAALVTATAVVGSLLGGLLAGRIPQDALRKSFGWFVAVMGVFVLGQQISSDLRQTLLTSPWTCGSAAAAAGIVFSWYMLRGSDGRTPERAGDVSASSDDASGRTVSRSIPAETGRSNGTTASPHDA